MKTMERWLFKAVLIQLILLLAVQVTLHLTKGELFLSKVVQYEGVNNMSIEDWIETFKQKDS
ncbi:YpfB family protein [Bacillus altitudinis]|uniref:YpfB family protein n=1 Tax=Bacillus altitudinis TaxID=293387 RepID=UPI003F7BD316